MSDRPNVKKAFQNIVSFLEANKTKKVSEVLENIYSLSSAKNGSSKGTTYLADDKNTIVAIHCWYFKRWMPLIGSKLVKFGQKKGTSTGFNTMSLKGSSLWSKQNSAFKKDTTALLDQLTAKTLKVEDIPAAKEKIKLAKDKIEFTELGFKTKDEVIKYLAQNKITVVSD